MEGEKNFEDARIKLTRLMLPPTKLTAAVEQIVDKCFEEVDKGMHVLGPASRSLVLNLRIPFTM